jgi:hypothetical protein
MKGGGPSRAAPAARDRRCAARVYESESQWQRVEELALLTLLALGACDGGK